MQYKTIYSISPEEFRSLFEGGHLLLCPPRLSQQITNITREVFSIQSSNSIINLTKNTNKMLILLRHLKNNGEYPLNARVDIKVEVK